MNASMGVAGPHGGQASSGQVAPARLWLSHWPARLLLLLVLLRPAWAIDKSLVTWSRQKSVRQALDGFRSAGRQFGEPLGIGFIVLAAWTLDSSSRRRVPRLILAVLLAGGVAAGLKLLASRERPKVTGGETVWRGPHWPGTMHPDSSFPSGHTAAAFALAYGLARLYPRGRYTFLLFAAACGASRALGCQHFLTDVLVGGYLGWEVAGIVWNPRAARAIWDRVQGLCRRRGADWSCAASLSSSGSACEQGGSGHGTLG